jgi:hypothetical protein
MYLMRSKKFLCVSRPLRFCHTIMLRLGSTHELRISTIRMSLVNRISGDATQSTPSLAQL